MIETPATAKIPYPFSFTGTGGEYFRIWIVNILLTILTLGLYSAWAKVRTKRWMYANTQVDGQAFTYLARPMQLFWGHVLAWLLFWFYVVSLKFLPMLGGVLIVVLMLVGPWLIVSSLRFNARVSAYRGVRFDFQGSVGEAYKVYLFLPMLIPLTLGLILPYLAWRDMVFVVNNTYYGSTRAHFDGDLRSFQAVYLKTLGLILLPIAMGGLAYLLVSEDPAWVIGLIALVPFVFYGWMLVVGAFFQARMGNLAYNGTQWGAVNFESRLQARRLIGLYLSNVLLLIVTLGLFYPWARVRLARYHAAQLTLLSSESLEHFSGGQAQPVSATGAEVSDAFDLTAGLV